MADPTPTPPPEPEPAWRRALARWQDWLRPGHASPGPQKLRLNLALQGGGAHGAYTWGVLDALLEHEALELEGLSGSSAGAVNAVLLADGWVRAGRAGARAALAQFWGELGQHLPASLVRSKGETVRLAPAGRLLAHWAAQFTPAQLNPFDLNPLRDLLERQIDFERLRRDCPFKLYIGATQVNTGRLRLFREHEISAEVLLASACLPKIHHTVHIDGEPYWDGGYSANPAIAPLVYDCATPDVLLVLLNPLRRSQTPRSLAEIETRLVELGFGTHIMNEMRHFAQAARHAHTPRSATPSLQRLLQQRFHLIGGEELDSLAHSESKLIPHTPFLQHLHQQGRAHAQAWLHDSAALVGLRSSIDVEALFG